MPRPGRERYRRAQGSQPGSAPIPSGPKLPLGLRLVNFAKSNPIAAGVYGVAICFVLALILVVVKLVYRPAGPTPTDLSALEQEPNIAKRVRKLVEIEGDVKKHSPRYQEVMMLLLGALTRDEGLPEEVGMFAAAASEAGDIENEDFAWQVQIDRRIRRGVWPKYPSEPPKDPKTRQLLRDVLKAQPRIEVALPKDPEARERWLRFAVENHDMEKNPKAPVGPVLGEFYKDNASQETQLGLYQQVVSYPPGQWLARQLYEKLTLLPEPLYVSDTEKEAPPVPVAYGPDHTLLFVGVLEGERCAIATEAKALPPLWVRPCKGLEPRRLAKGELYLIGVDAKYDLEAPMHWLPLLVEDSGAVTIGTGLRAKVSDRILGSFIVAATRYVHDGKSFRQFPPALDLVTAGVGQERIVSFRTAAIAKLAPQLMAFAGNAKASWVLKDKQCAKVDTKERCELLRGGGEDEKCEIGAPVCAQLPGGAVLRWTRSTVIRPQPCLKEYGRKSTCPTAVSSGMFVDIKQKGSDEFIAVLHASLHEKQPESDGITGD